MSKLIVMILSLLPLSFSFASGVSEKEILNLILPEKLKSVKLNETSKSMIVKEYGEPQKTVGDIDYYELEGIRYPFAVKYGKDGTVIYISYMYPKPSLKLKDLKNYVTEKDLTDAAMAPREMGLHYKAKKGKISFEFRNNSEMTLTSFIWGI